MSKIFSVVELETSTGISDSGLMGGIPDHEDVENSALYQKLVEDCGSSEYVNITVNSYIYGEGESENANDEDLKWIKSQEDFINSDEATPIQNTNFTILYPNQGQKFM